MTTLHILNKTFYDNCQQAVAPNDVLLLIQDGVYLMLNQNFIDFVTKNSIHTLYALQNDAVARGLKPTTASAKLIDYQRFVELTVNHSPIVSW